MRKKENVDEWLQDFLTDKSQVVAADGVHSRGTLVTNGMQKGTVLGSLVFVTNISKTAKTARLNYYADDTKVARTAKDSLNANL